MFINGVDPHVGVLYYQCIFIEIKNWILIVIIIDNDTVVDAYILLF